MRDETGGMTTMTIVSHSTSGVANDKYGGLIQRSMYKIIRDTFNQYLNYVYSVAPNYIPLHMTIAVFRLLQLVGPSLSAQISRFWGADSFDSKVISIFSIFFNLVPPEYRIDASFYYFVFFLVINVLFVIFMFSNALIFKKSATLPAWSVSLTSIVLSSFHYLSFPILFELAGQTFSYYAYAKEIKSYENEEGMIIEDVIPLGKLENLLLAIISIIFCCFFTWFILKAVMSTLFFRPSSFLTVTFLPQLIIFFETCLINFFIGFSANLETAKDQGGVLILVSMIYFVSLANSFLHGGFVQPIISTAIIVSNAVGFIMSLIVACFLFSGKKGGIILFFIFIVLFVAAFIGVRILMSRIRIKDMQLIDQIYDNNENFNRIKTVNRLYMVAVHGFQVSHPACLNWQIFKLGIDKFEKSKLSWFCFSKFVAIYPENTQNLTWISRTLVTMKMHGNIVRTIKEQALIISRQREANLSPELKSKLNALLKDLTNTKHKLRHVWDLVIQGNINEMESASKKAFHEINECDSKFIRLFGQYPNNRFVSRQYARFCREIKADFTQFNEMIEKTRLLQRGEIVNEDQANSLGMRAFPGLPKFNFISGNDRIAADQSQSISRSEILEETEEGPTDNDQRALLKKRIDDLRIPSTFGTSIIRTLTLICLFIVPTIVMFLYVNSFVDSIQYPLGFLFDVSNMRTMSFQLGAFSLHALYEQVEPFVWMRMAAIPNITLENLGNSYHTRDQLLFLMNKATITIQNMLKYRSFDNNNPNILEALNLMFGYTYDYFYMVDEDMFKATVETVSVQTAINDFVIQCNEIAQFPSPDYPDEERDDFRTGQFDTPIIDDIDDVINTALTMNMAVNTELLNKHFEKVLDNILEYIYNTNINTQKIGSIIMIVIIVAIILILFIELAIEIIWINNNKREVYRCLASLPKNVVSNIAENLRALQKNEATNNSETTEELSQNEINKQEDNMMKILATGAGSANGFGDRVMIVLSTLVTVGLEIWAAITLVELFQSESMKLAQNAPHLSYLQGCYGMYVASIYSFMGILANLSSVEEMKLKIPYEPLIPLVAERASKGDYYYNLARYGGSQENQIPFFGFEKGITDASNRHVCDDEYGMITSFADVVSCYSADMSLLIFYPLLQSKTTAIALAGSDLSFEEKEYNIIPAFENVWSLLNFPIFDSLIEPMFQNIISVIRADMDENRNKDFPLIVSLMVVSFVFEIFAFIQTRLIESHIRQVLMLVMHCPPEIVLQTSKIMTILSGDFSRIKTDSASKNASFFKRVVLDLPDIIVTTDSDGKIDSVNKSSSRILMIDDSEAIGKNLKEFMSERFTGDVDKIFSTDNNIQQQTSSTSRTIMITYQRSDQTEVNLELNNLLVNNKTVVVARDITQTVRYNSLIAEEREKSDKLLASILPPNLVQRVQKGEKNISFAVQSATIVFMDIVEFTPWCGSLPADKVMSTLNLLFKKFDSCSAKYSTMTKIKCIGDCYMGAGGVFDNINNPAQHAKDVVNFGLDSIENVLDINQEINEKLRIRVGINTGGPIVAGVLGIGKPTFEILGPAINMAQQMEHNGVPMQVHVSRPVYEFIYGDAFVVKERGAINVKNGTVVTYLVSRKT